MVQCFIAVVAILKTSGSSYLSLREQLLADKSGLFNAEPVGQSRELVGAFSEFNIIYKHFCMLLSMFDSDQLSGLAPEFLFEARQGYKFRKLKNVYLRLDEFRIKYDMSELRKLENMDKAINTATMKTRKSNPFFPSFQMKGIK